MSNNISSNDSLWDSVTVLRKKHTYIKKHPEILRKYN